MRKQAFAGEFGGNGILLWLVQIRTQGNLREPRIADQALAWSAALMTVPDPAAMEAILPGVDILSVGAGARLLGLVGVSTNMAAAVHQPPIRMTSACSTCSMRFSRTALKSASERPTD